jgi:hypothetical protein
MAKATVAGNTEKTAARNPSTSAGDLAHPVAAEDDTLEEAERFLDYAYRMIEELYEDTNTTTEHQLAAAQQLIQTSRGIIERIMDAENRAELAKGGVS